RPVALRPGRPESPLPGRPQPEGLPDREHRDPELRLETGAPGVHDLLRGTNPNTMTATITYTDLTVPPRWTGAAESPGGRTKPDPEWCRVVEELCGGRPRCDGIRADVGPPGSG